MKITAKSQPILSAIIPARNEQVVIAACIASLAQQPEIAEIIVVNDQSADDTGPIVQGLMKIYPQLRLLEATRLPSGWVGTNHAVYQGAREAKGDWLLFTDADVIHGPHSVHKALQIAGTHNAALISFSPEQLTESWHEKSLIPVIYSRLASKFSFDKINDPNNPAAAANGHPPHRPRSLQRHRRPPPTFEKFSKTQCLPKSKTSVLQNWSAAGKSSGVHVRQLFRQVGRLEEESHRLRVASRNAPGNLVPPPILLAGGRNRRHLSFTRDSALVFHRQRSVRCAGLPPRRELMYNQYSLRLVW
jgi:hypothetical protein